MALMRFGNFTNLEYMTSSAAEGDYSTFAFAASSYQSNYVVFQPYEVYNRADNPLMTLPANYSSADQQYGKSSIPFLDFAGKYVVSGLSYPILHCLERRIGLKSSPRFRRGIHRGARSSRRQM